MTLTWPMMLYFLQLNNFAESWHSKYHRGCNKRHGVVIVCLELPFVQHVWPADCPLGVRTTYRVRKRQRPQEEEHVIRNMNLINLMGILMKY